MNKPEDPTVVSPVVQPQSAASPGSIVMLYLLTALASCVIVFFVFELWHANLSIPFGYEWRNLHAATKSLDPNGSGDALLFCAMTKGMIENGWFLHNSFIGMPTGLDLYDYPFGENLHFLLMKMISLCTSQYGVVVNVFFLLGFPGPLPQFRDAFCGFAG